MTRPGDQANLIKARFHMTMMDGSYDAGRFLLMANRPA